MTYLLVSREEKCSQNLDEPSNKLVTINSTKGLFRYTRLLFRVALAPAVFQKTMEIILQGMPHVICYVDDNIMLITGCTEDEHMNRVGVVTFKK